MQFDQLKRRELITLLGGAAAAWPLAARGQERVRRVGALMSLAEDDPEDRQRRAAFQQALRQLGWTEGGNLRIDYRWYGGDPARARALAKELVELEPDLIVATATPALTALALQMRPIPIVFVAVSDPVGQGFVASLARPGGNATGVSVYAARLGSKRLALLHEMVPSASPIAILVNPTNPDTEDEAKDIQDAAQGLGVQVFVVRASKADDLDSAFTTLAQHEARAVIVGGDTFFTSRRSQISLSAARRSLPTMWVTRIEVEAGGLMSYGANPNVYRQAGVYAGQILKGAKPANLPVQLPIKFDLVINLQTAKALGLEVPATLLARADEVIE
jgi:putative tryptophan/tyrosine transport system substrate-binding protein